MADIVAPANVGQCLTRLTSRQCFRTLMRGELGLAAEPNATSLRPLATLIGPRLDQLPFKLGQPAKHGQRQPAVGRRASAGAAGAAADIAVAPMAGDVLEQFRKRKRPPAD
jgi:hypothetical protein